MFLLHVEKEGTFDSAGLKSRGVGGLIFCVRSTPQRAGLLLRETQVDSPEQADTAVATAALPNPKQCRWCFPCPTAEEGSLTCAARSARARHTFHPHRVQFVSLLNV